MHISDGILESAYLTVGDNPDAQSEWIEIFKNEVDMQLPDNVELDLETCKQVGSGVHLSDDEFIKILRISEDNTDKVFQE